MLVLPGRYLLRDGVSTTSLDVLLNVLLGCSATEIRDAYDLVHFTCVRGESSTDRVLAVLDRQQEKQQEEEEGLWGNYIEEVSFELAVERG